MKLVGICGHFAQGRDFSDGQTVKTRAVAAELERFGVQIERVDTCGWRKNPLRLLAGLVRAARRCSCVIIMPDFNGLKVLARLLVLLKRVFGCGAYYIVIGGWLPDYLPGDRPLARACARLDGVFVETEGMARRLRVQGLANVRVLPNIKRLPVLLPEELPCTAAEPYRLCTFSRVFREKGIEDAIAAVRMVNGAAGRTVYSLDIYGKVSGDYADTFRTLMRDAPDCIRYRGAADPNRSVEVLKDYFALLFPTYYASEGFAGTLLDAMSAGVPVLASDWQFNGEIVRNGYNGLLFETHNVEMLARMLTAAAANPDDFLRMRRNCIRCAHDYDPDVVVPALLSAMGL